MTREWFNKESSGISLKVGRAVGSVQASLMQNSVGNVAQVTVRNASVLTGTGILAPYTFKVHIKITSNNIVLLDGVQDLYLGAGATGTVSMTFNVPGGAWVSYSASAWLNSTDDSLMIVVPVSVSGPINLSLANVTGHVYESAPVYPGPAIPGVTVSIAGMLTVTDASGAFGFAGVVQGDYTMTFTKTGLVNGSRAVTVGEGTTVVDQSMYPPNVTIFGKVSAAGGPALAGVLLQITGGPSATTNVNGDYTMVLDYASYTLTVTKTGYVTQTLNIVIMPIGGKILDISMTPLPPPPPPPAPSFTMARPSVTLVPDDYAPAWYVANVAMVISNPTSAPITHNLICYAAYAGGSFTRQWGNNVDAMSFTLQPGQSMTIVNPGNKGAAGSNTPGYSTQEVARYNAGTSYWWYYFVDEIGGRSPNSPTGPG
ncbi:MAG: hypothetical protein Q8O55_07505 [Dehalococcoidales bacterium]|nr:hypothetical protein [Dehalococcoidales bacterium]